MAARLIRQMFFGVILLTLVYVIILYHKPNWTITRVFPRPSEAKRTVSNRTEFVFLRSTGSSRGEVLKSRWRRFYNDTGCFDNEMRAQLTELLNYWNKFTKNNNISYAIMWGSLLGLLRTNDIMAWDYDIDVIVSLKDLVKLRKLAEAEGSFDYNDGNIHLAVMAEPEKSFNTSAEKRARLSCRGEAVDKVMDPCSFVDPLARLLLKWFFIDIYTYVEVGDKLFALPEGKRFVMNKADMFPLQRCHYMGLECLCPRNPERLLEDWYGPGCVDANEFKCRDGVWQNQEGERPKKDWRL
ncbi:uncharacterized protein LOC5502070 [Nematostella vectensis]|uniref:uncharacterized protein LOC5502070 n=1 Tax=Nematostella vectensis TaxID=45351 RepID=UPI002076E8D7|nr:uncharacterized protein LOC5502070 [Nematostella vectensis]